MVLTGWPQTPTKGAGRWLAKQRTLKAAENSHTLGPIAQDGHESLARKTRRTDGHKSLDRKARRTEWTQSLTKGTGSAVP
jgi:hypothetical protein